MKTLRLVTALVVLTVQFVSGQDNSSAVETTNKNQSARVLPDMMVTQKGQKVTSMEIWDKVRRPEILKLFRENVYGRAPIERPTDLRFMLTDTSDAMEGKATRKLVTISYHGQGQQGAIQLVMFVPKGHTNCPCFLLICNRGSQNIDPTRTIRSPFWPAEQIINRGYAAAAFCNTDVAPDKSNGFTNGVYPLFDDAHGRGPDSWGAIAAWAWGASRVMDYLQTDGDIDGRRVALVGHSRGGKTALWAGAEDERFAMVVSNDSGSTGAALARGKQGERVRDINESFPHWFCQNYKRYNDREYELPVDQQMLAGLIAPRLLYVASATEDFWSDPKSEFLGAVNAEPIFQLCGVAGLTTSVMPQPEKPLNQGHIGYHLRTGKHDLTEYDWNCFMDYADKHLKQIP